MGSRTPPESHMGPASLLKIEHFCQMKIKLAFHRISK